MPATAAVPAAATMPTAAAAMPGGMRNRRRQNHTGQRGSGRQYRERSKGSHGIKLQAKVQPAPGSRRSYDEAAIGAGPLRRLKPFRPIRIVGVAADSAGASASRRFSNPLTSGRPQPFYAPCVSGYRSGSIGRAACLPCRGVAQLARAPVSKTGGWGFETLHPCQRPASALYSVATGFGEQLRGGRSGEIRA